MVHSKIYRTNMAKFWWRSLVATWPRQSNFCTRRDVPQSDAHATVRVAFVLSTATSRCFSAEFTSWRAACEIAHNRAEPAAAHFGTEECDTCGAANTDTERALRRRFLPKVSLEIPIHSQLHAQDRLRLSTTKFGRNFASQGYRY